MKRYLLLILVLFFSFNFGYTQTTRPFILQGKMPSTAKGYLYLNYPKTDNTWQKDSALLDNGNFIFKGLLHQPTVARLSTTKSAIQIILEPTMMVATLSTAENLANLQIMGSKSQDELAELNRSLQKVETRWKVVLDTLNVISKRSNVAFQEYKGWVLDPYFKEIEELNRKFINKYPSSFASAHILQVFARELSTDTLKVFYDRFPGVVKQSRYGKNIEEQLAKRKLGVPGTLAANFTKQDINGKKIALSALQGKYVLLDFWGSWCVPCRKGNPHLISLYQKYKDKGFEILGVAADDNSLSAWRKAVADDKLPWLQVLQGNTPSTDIGKLYNIMYYPTKILIDTKGTIIGRFGEDSAALDALLEKVFTSPPLPSSQ